MDQSNNWQKHLDDLPKHYHPKNFFPEQFSKSSPKNITEEHFFIPSLLDAAELANEGKLAIDFSQDEKNFYVSAPLAGVDPAKIEISLNNDALTIRGERQQISRQKKLHYLHQECYWGKFSRTLILPGPVQTKNIKAEFKNGILHITLPKMPENTPINIPLKNH